MTTYVNLQLRWRVGSAIIDLNNQLSKLFSFLHLSKQCINLLEIAQPLDRSTDNWSNLLLIHKGNHVSELLSRPHGRPLQLNVRQHRLHHPIHLGRHRHAVLRNHAAGLEQPDRLGHDLAAGSVDDGIEVGAVLGEDGLQVLFPGVLLVVDAALGAELNGLFELGFVARGHEDVAAKRHGELEDLEGDAAADAGDENVLPGPSSAALGDEGAPAGEADERERGPLGGREVLGRQLNLVLVHGDVVERGADLGELGAARDGELPLVLGPRGVGLPPAHGRQDDGLVQEVGARDVGPDGLDGAVAIGEERVGEGDGGIQVVADEEVAVVEGRCGHADEDLLGAWFWLGDFFDLEAGVLYQSWGFLIYMQGA